MRHRQCGDRCPRNAWIDVCVSPPCGAQGPVFHENAQSQSNRQEPCPLQPTPTINGPKPASRNSRDDALRKPRHHDIAERSDDRGSRAGLPVEVDKKGTTLNRLPNKIETERDSAEEKYVEHDTSRVEQGPGIGCGVPLGDRLHDQVTPVSTNGGIGQSRVSAMARSNSASRS